MRVRVPSSRRTRPAWPASRFPGAALVAAFFLVAGCEASATPAGAVSAAAEVPDTLALLDLHLATATLDSVMAAEERQLDARCPAGQAECRQAHDPHRIVPLDTLRAHAADSAPPLGVLAAHVRVTEDGWLQADLAFVRTTPENAPGDSTRPLHLKSLGDWGYGVQVAVRHWTVVARPDGGTRQWVRFPGAGSVEGGWLAFDEGGLRGWITPADDPVWAMASPDPGSPRAGAAFQPFRILGIADGWVTVREEIPSDMPCELDPPSDPPNPAVTRIRLSELFSASGMPRVETAYPRGC